MINAEDIPLYTSHFLLYKTIDSMQSQSKSHYVNWWADFSSGRNEIIKTSENNIEEINTVGGNNCPQDL